MSNEDTVLKDRLSYEIITSHYLHAEQIRWAIVYNFLTANMILILSWTALINADFFEKKIALSFLCIVGIILSSIWFLIARRSSKFTDKYSKLGLEVEERLKLEGAYQGAKSLRETEMNWLEEKVRSKIITQAIPLVFLALYSVLLCLSLN